MLNRSAMIGEIASAARRNGKVRKTSVKKAITESMTPPAYPATRPRVTPMIVEATVAMNARNSEVRQPYIQ